MSFCEGKPRWVDGSVDDDGSFSVVLRHRRCVGDDGFVDGWLFFALFLDARPRERHTSILVDGQRTGRYVGKYRWTFLSQSVRLLVSFQPISSIPLGRESRKVREKVSFDVILTRWLGFFELLCGYRCGHFRHQ